jgi:hypothetical protein|tara:strand:- start:231 stop:635 length:405 start_codon:yes stop_codon:yes gene_type:complete
MHENYFHEWFIPEEENRYSQRKQRKSTLNEKIFNVISFPFFLLIYSLNLFCLAIAPLLSVTYVYTIPIDVVLFLFVKRKFILTRGFTSWVWDIVEMILKDMRLYNINRLDYYAYKRKQENTISWSLPKELRKYD